MSYPMCKPLQTVKCHTVFSVKGQEQLCSYHICDMTLISFFLPSFL